MKIFNHTKTPIHVEDINVVLFPGEKGNLVEDNLVSKSKQLLSLVRSKKMSISVCETVGYRSFRDENGEKYIVSGKEIWRGDGKTKAHNEAEQYKSLVVKSNSEVDFQVKENKKYLLSKKVESNICVDSIPFVFTKNNPSILIEEEKYGEEIKGLISKGILELSGVFRFVVGENGIGALEKADPSEEDVKIDKINDTCCFWEGPIFDAGGYAHMNREFVSRLSDFEVSVKPTLISTANQVESSWVEKITRLSRLDIPANSPKVYSTNVPSKHGGYTVAYTMMETEGKVHKDLANSMSVADELWVPSKWNRDIFYDGGVRKPINIMPLGIDTNKFQPRPKSVFFDFPVKKFVFYSVSTWLWRKGFDVLLRAYSKAFSADDDVSLIIFSHVPLVPRSSFDSIIESQIGDIGRGANLPHLAIITDVLPSKVVPLIYNSVDTFALFSRGEGWGLPYCEAASSGLPVVGADHGGQKMFLNNDNSYLVKPDIVTPCHSTLLKISPFYVGMNFVNYSEKAVSEAASLLREVFENQKEAKEKAKKCRDGIIKNYTWDLSTKKIADRLREI